MFSQRLDLRQSQNLVMTPQLQQAIKLLQLNNVELSELVEKELAENPLLERAAPDGEGGSAEDFDQATATPDVAVEKDVVQEGFDESWTGNEADTSAPHSSDFDAGSSMATIGAGGGTSFDDPDQSFEERLTERKSLRDHLTEQLHIAFDNHHDRIVGEMLIDLLDESGYLRHDTAELVERLGCKPERAERLLTTMKQFDPTGVFAHDLKECLALQLEEKGGLDAPMRILLDHLNLLAGHDYAKLAALCGVNDTYLRDMIEEVRALNPRPISDFDHLVVQTAIPDVLMRRLPKNLGGGWRVELNSETLPRVLINNSYYTEVAQKSAGDKKNKAWLNEQMTAASWLVKALDQRAKTILKVAGELIEQQEAFFLYGIEFLKPMTLKDIAEKIEMHESTVSRVTTNKYIGTPRGIFELKFFFSTALTGADGVSHAAESIRARVKALIEAETPNAVLSDDDIVLKLKAEGIEVARRTVAKYRDALRIPSSVQRRKQKRG
jgi:RNA polymerase sigma-54 factor